MFKIVSGARGAVFSAALLLSPLSAHATTLTANEILTQFTLVVFGDHKLDSQVHGRAFIGGNVSGNGGSMTTGNYNLPVSDFANVSIAGNHVSGGMNTVGGASVEIGGNNSTHINNAGSVKVGGKSVNINPHLTVGVADLKLNLDSAMSAFQTTMTAASQTLRKLQQTDPEFKISNNFNAIPVDGRFVYNISSSDLTSSDLNISLNGADTIVINVAGTNISLSQNFNTPENVGANVLWNFFEAETLALNNRFVGSVLAPNAAFSNGNNVFGSVVVSSFTQGSQIHQQSWAGNLPGGPGSTPSPVPLPAAAWLMLGALGMLVGLRRRKHA